MKLTISCLLVLFLTNGLAAQNGYFNDVSEYSNDVLVLQSGRVLAGRLHAHPNPDSVLMIVIGKVKHESVAKVDVSRSISERVLWKPYGPDLNWVKVPAEKNVTEATKKYTRQSFILKKGFEYRGEVVSETKDVIVLKSSYTQRDINIDKKMYKKRRNELVFQSDLLLDKLPESPKKIATALEKKTVAELPINQNDSTLNPKQDGLAEPPVRQSKGFLGVHFGIAFPMGSFAESTYNMQFTNNNLKNTIGGARVGTELSINGIFLFKPGSQLGVGLIGQFNRNSVSSSQNLSYETNLLAMGLAVALPLHPDKISFLDIRCMGGVAAFSASRDIIIPFSQSREAVLAYEQGYGPAFVVDAGLRFKLRKRIELGFRIGHSVAIIDNIQSINVNGASNTPMDFQKLNKVNSSNVTMSIGLGIGL